MTDGLTQVWLVGVQLGLYALGWCGLSLLLRQDRPAALSWAAFTALAGAGFVLAAYRDETRGWWAYTASSICFVVCYPALGHGLGAMLRLPSRTRVEVAAIAAVTVVLVLLGPGVEHAVARVLVTYGAGVLFMVAVLFRVLRPLHAVYGRGLALFLAAPAALLVAMLGSRLLLQALHPDTALELQRDAEAAHWIARGYLVAAAYFNFCFVALLVARLIGDLRRQSLQDPLTGLPNRRAFQEQLAQAWSAPAGERALALLALDLDHFKQVNDEHGHAAGDAVLRQSAERLRAALGADGVLARTGGEEFVALVRGPAVRHLPDLAERLRRALADAPLVLDGTSQRRVTVSIGAATAQVSDPDADRLLRRADRALYSAKAAGRNRVHAG